MKALLNYVEFQILSRRGIGGSGICDVVNRKSQIQNLKINSVGKLQDHEEFFVAFGAKDRGGDHRFTKKR